MDAQMLENLCRDWICRVSDRGDEAPSDAGEAVEVAIDGPGYKEDALFAGPLGYGFRAGLDFGLHLAVALTGGSLENPTASVKSALEHATRRMRELHASQNEEFGFTVQQLAHRLTETEITVPTMSLEQPDHPLSGSDGRQLLYPWSIYRREV